MSAATIKQDVVSVRRHVAVDLEPDLSWLEQDCWNDPTDTEPAGYGQRRIDAYNAGEWWTVGVYVTLHDEHGAEIARSAGLWGIESDSDVSYFGEVANEEIRELEAAYSIDLSSYDVEEVEE